MRGFFVVLLNYSEINDKRRGSIAGISGGEKLIL
jgi:hypothetical protein